MRLWRWLFVERTRTLHLMQRNGTAFFTGHIRYTARCGIDAFRVTKLDGGADVRRCRTCLKLERKALAVPTGGDKL